MSSKRKTSLGVVGESLPVDVLPETPDGSSEDQQAPGKTGEPSPRRQGREMALQMLFQWDAAASHQEQIFRSFDVHLYGHETAGSEKSPSQTAFSYAQALVRGVLEHHEEIDTRIVERAENWRLERMAVVDRNILRLAVYEFLAEPDVPKVVVLDEAIELAKRFGTEHSGSFINGMLDAILHGERFPGRVT